MLSGFFMKNNENLNKIILVTTGLLWYTKC